MAGTATIQTKIWGWNVPWGLTEMECESWVEISAVFSHKAPLYWILTLTDLLSWQYSKKGRSGKTHRINRVTQESSKLVPYIWFWILMKWNAKNDFVTDSLDYKKKTVSCEETRVFLPDRTLRLHFVIPELVRFMRNFWESWTSFLSKKNFLKIKPKLLLVWYYVVLLALKNTSCEKYLFMLFLPFRTKKLPYYVRFRFKKEMF